MMTIAGIQLDYSYLALAVAVIIFLVALLFMASLKQVTDKRAKAVRERLDALAMAHAGAQPLEIVRRESLSEVPWFNRTLSRTSWAKRLDLTIQQGRSPGKAGMYVLASALAGLIGFYISWVFLDSLLLLVIMTVFPAAMPFWWLRRKKNKRMRRFQAQLPDALDLVARAMQAGHSFYGGLRMAADECDDPIAGEFGITMDEINFGVAVEEALANLLHRVDCTDLKFFVVSVIVQRETGGNLSEIIGNIALLVRERFKLMGRVQVLSAEGRLSAWILIALPFAVASVLFLLNPEYMNTLIEHPLGKHMIQGAVGMMTLGIVVIKRLIKIKV